MDIPEPEKRQQRHVYNDSPNYFCRAAGVRRTAATIARRPKYPETRIGSSGTCDAARTHREIGFLPPGT